MSTWAGNGNGVDNEPFGEGPQLTTSLALPHGIAFGDDGALYVAAMDSDRVVQIKNGMISLVAGNDVEEQIDGAGQGASFLWPNGLAFAPVDRIPNLFVAEAYSRYHSESDNEPGHTIRRLTLQAGSWGVISLKASGTEPQLSYPVGVAADPITGTVYVAEYGNHCIRKLVLGGNPQFPVVAGECGVRGYADGPALGAARFNEPQGLAVQGQQVFVAENSNHCIRMIEGGQVITIAGACDTPGSSDEPARFRNPSALAVDSGGVLYVSDAGNHCVRRLVRDRAGDRWQVSTIAGTCGENTGGYVDGPGADAQFSNVHGLALGEDGALYVADPENNRIRKLAR